MRVVIQRVLSSSVSINHKIYAEIEKGMLIFIGIEKDKEYHKISTKSIY